MDELKKLLSIMQSHGAYKFYAKKLAPNDNSKNQVYLGDDFKALNILPFGTVETDDGSQAGAKRDRAKAALSFFWIDEDGTYEAPEAKLIFYPRYPEVRMSGFLKRTRNAPSKIMACRDEGRTLFLGVTPDGEILAYAIGPDSPLRRQLDALGNPPLIGVFIELSVDAHAVGDTRGQLLAELLRIHRKSWIPSQRLGAAGIMPYAARNGGGYTLEAELGISPNGYADPDFLGWEVKQYGVNNFTAYRAKSPVTLMTPEPTGGVYKTDGFEAFIRRFGYADQNGAANRLNFGGVYKVGGACHPRTQVALKLLGFDEDEQKISDITQGIALAAEDGTIAAIWRYADLLEHWNRKHAKAVYVPSLKQGPPIEYAYGGIVELGVGTDFNLFIKAIAAGTIYFDPGMKLENTHLATPTPKKRSQFRVRHVNLSALYSSMERVKLG